MIFLEFHVSCIVVSLSLCTIFLQWCMKGQCVPIDSYVRPVDGSWSAWSFAAPCSRTCGGGVQVQRRKCNNPPPQYGGRTCPGFPTKAKICNMQACTSDFRYRQCSTAFPQWLEVEPDLELWESTSYDWESCKMRCANSSSTQGKGVYQDGTECLTDQEVPFGRCVDGRCRIFGCDGRSESFLKFDVCGICNGRGNTCGKVSGRFNLTGSPHNYSFVTKIPKESSNVNITQSCRRCFLSIVVDGVRILNADGTPRSSAIYNMLGVQIRYVAMPENVLILGKLQADITVEVYKHDSRGVPDVRYEYYTPLPQQMMYAWAEVPHPSCSATCGNGTRAFTTGCMSIQGKFVDDTFCDIMSKPNIKTVPCNSQPCPPRWEAGEWGPCSTPCTKPCDIGNQTRSVACIRLENRVEKQISASQCNRETMPVQQKHCMVKSCQAGLWRNDSWSECSAACGEGYKQRRVYCVSVEDKTCELWDNSCDPRTKPAEIDRCFLDFCFANEYCRDVDTSKCLSNYMSDVTACDKGWIRKNCSATCKVCLAGFSTDQIVCRNVEPSVNACTNPNYSLWMRRMCPQTCRICQDYKDCSLFEKKYCRDPTYTKYMNKYCAKTCGFC